MNLHYIQRTLRAAVILTLFAVGVFAETANGQILSRGDLFGPGAPPPMIGVEAGFASHSQIGTFQAACGCDFDEGSGSGFVGNILFELPIDYSWAFGIKTGIDFKNTSGTAFVHDTAVIRFVRNGDSLTTSGRIDFNREGDVSLTYLNFIPYARYQFYRDGPFLQLGAGIDLLVGSHFTHKRTLTKTTAQLEDNTTIDNIKFENGTREETLEDGEVTNASGIRLGALLTFGYDFPASERSVISPMITIDYPISAVRQENAQGWKLSTVEGSVAFKFKLN